MVLANSAVEGAMVFRAMIVGASGFESAAVAVAVVLVVLVVEARELHRPLQAMAAGRLPYPWWNWAVALFAMGPSRFRSATRAVVGISQPMALASPRSIVW
jgi:hypothetical protein